MSKMKIVLLGAPGSGKGTQAEKISAYYSLPIIGTGQILRESIKNGESLGLKAQSFIENGLLTPDNIIMGIVKERLAQPDCRKGFILDGTPRTLPQAKALEKITNIDFVLDFEVNIEEVVKRISGRIFCGVCGAIYNSNENPPKRKGFCDKDGGALKQRADDNEVSVRKRMREYGEKTKPLKEFYAKKKALHVINASEPIGKVFENIKRVISEAKLK
jgi:adenylate kinase